MISGTREEVDEVASKLMGAALSLEEGVDVATLMLRVTERDRREAGTRVFISEIVNNLQHILNRLPSRPHPEPVLHFLLSNQPRIRLSFDRDRNPLVTFLEKHTYLLKQDQKRLDPKAAPPPPHVLAELESLRVRHLDAVRAIRQTMKDFEEDVFSIRSYTSLMDGYNHGRAFADVEEIWKLMRSEGGVGINSRAVAVVSLFPVSSGRRVSLSSRFI